jgi:hypothetical protein
MRKSDAKKPNNIGFFIVILDLVDDPYFIKDRKHGSSAGVYPESGRGADNDKRKRFLA